MKSRPVLAFALVCSGLAGVLAFANPAQPADPLKPCAFLEGSWLQSEADGSFAEEIWSPRRGNSIIGSFRWSGPDGKALMFEILAIVQEADGVIRLRLRHFTPELKAAMGEDGPIVLKLTETADQRAVFEAEGPAKVKGVSYVVKDATLTVTVTFPEAEGQTREPLIFNFKKQ